MTIDDVRRILVLGAGMMGQGIALQCALHGYDVVLYDIDRGKLDAAMNQLRFLMADLIEATEYGREAVERAAGGIVMTSDPAEAARGVHVVSESVPESLKIKREVFAQFNALCPPETIFATNTSFHLPSRIAAATGRPDRFAALHFHNPVWLANVVDVMPHPETAPETIELLALFARRIGQIPIVCRKETHGYVFNAMLRPLLQSAITLAESGVTGFEDIDRAFMGVMRSQSGPFGILDVIGLDTIREVMTYWRMLRRDPQDDRNIEFLKQRIETGHLGAKVGRGFYTYPHPEYLRPGFLTGDPATDDRQVYRSSGRPPEFAAEQVEVSTSSAGWPGLDRREAPELRAPGFRKAPTPATQHGNIAPQPATVADRLLLRMAPAATHERIRHSPRLHGPALILGENPAATALRERLEALGASVATIPRTEELNQSVAWLEQLWSRQPAPHLFLMSALDDEAVTRCDKQWASDRLSRGLMLPFLVCQNWFRLAVEADLLDWTTLLAATRLGGDFGISGRVRSAESGGMTGLVKSVFMEGGLHHALGPQVKVVDVSPETTSERVADLLLDEMALAQASVVAGTRDELSFRFAELEVGYVNEQRQVVRVAREDPPPDRKPDIPPGGVWVVTGGARGISAIVARELGQRFGVHLHLVGRSPIPAMDFSRFTDEQLDEHRKQVMREAFAAKQKPNVAWDQVAKGIEIQKNLRSLADAGIKATYHACDVADAAAIAAMLEQIRQIDGPIQGIVHGAGIEITGRFERKPAETVRATLAPKFLGTLALMECTRNDPLRYFLAFGSLSGRFGGIGQADYAMANDVLAKLMCWFRSVRPECASVLIHWPAWDEVGMAARPESRAMLQRVSHAFMSPAEGVRHLLDELVAGAPDAEVVIVNARELPPNLLLRHELW